MMTGHAGDTGSVDVKSGGADATVYLSVHSPDQVVLVVLAPADAVTLGHALIEYARKERRA